MSEFAVELDVALARLEVLPDYDAGDGPGPHVHTLRQSVAGLMIGAHWGLGQVREVMERFGVEEAGGLASAMGHGLVVTDEDGPVFFATGPEGGREREETVIPPVEGS